MNQKIRMRIIEQAILQGLKYTNEHWKGHELTHYEGKVMVNFCGTDYQVIGRSAKKHAMSFTNGYCSITRRTISTGLR
jgi:hypothetical protein